MFLTAAKVQRANMCYNTIFVNIDQMFDTSQFIDFKMSTDHYLRFSKFKIFSSQLYWEGQCTLTYQISLKSVKWLRRYCILHLSKWWPSTVVIMQTFQNWPNSFFRYCNLSIFNIATDSHLGFSNFWQTVTLGGQL